MRFALALFLSFVLSLPACADDLIIFTATWCGPCQQLHRAIEADPVLLDGFKVVYVDFDKDRQTAQAHGVSVVPTLIATDEKGRKRRKVGFQGAADLRRWLRGGR